CNMAAACEAVVLAVKSGLDAKVAIDVINSSSGRNSGTQDKFPKSILTRKFDWGFATSLMTKDVRLALQEMKALNVPHDIMDAVERAWETAITELGAGSDFTEIVKPVEKRAGVVVGGEA
ncbi:MAG: NAD-binding protein, partial [Pseudolabrys sp.]|nr:NAD-binding protein [Pseudolabrys sp.]